QAQARTFTVKNLAVKGYIDAPKQNESLQGTSEVRGWYLSGSDVSKIEVYVDGKYQGKASYGLSRSDIQRAYPEYENGSAGYKYNLNTKVLTTGKHTLTIKETGVNGETQTQARIFTVKNLGALGNIEVPQLNETLQGISEIRGWYLSGSGIKRIEIYVDETYKGQANFGISRPDVMNAYSQYHENNSGYQYYLQTSELSAGRHTLIVKAISLNGETKTTNRTIYISKLPGGALKKGIDISHHQNDNGKINFDAIRESGVSFVIVKASEGTDVKDSNFEENINDARNAGLEVHAYHYFHSTGSDSDAKKEADLFASQLKKVNFNGYAFIDVEINGSKGTNVTNRITIFLNELKKQRITKIGVYSYKSYLNNYVNLDQLKKNFPGLIVWVAAYHDINLGPQFTTDLWQYSSSGNVPGIVGSVDMDFAYNFRF
ncbi:GH25 family lysozyme, partial [Sporolactobacillus nakayamae]